MGDEDERRVEEDDWMEGDDEWVVVDIEEEMGGSVEEEVAVSIEGTDDAGRVKVDGVGDTGTGKRESSN